MRKIILAADIDEWCTPALPVKLGEPTQIVLSLTKNGREYNVGAAALRAELPSGSFIETNSLDQHSGLDSDITANICSNNLHIEAEGNKVTLCIGGEVTAEAGEITLLLKLKKKQIETLLDICGVVS